MFRDKAVCLQSGAELALINVFYSANPQTWIYLGGTILKNILIWAWQGWFHFGFRINTTSVYPVVRTTSCSKETVPRWNSTRLTVFGNLPASRQVSGNDSLTPEPLLDDKCFTCSRLIRTVTIWGWVKKWTSDENCNTSVKVWSWHVSQSDVENFP